MHKENSQATPNSVSGGQPFLLASDFGILGYPARMMGSSRDKSEVWQGVGHCPEDLTMTSGVGLGQDAGSMEGSLARDI